MKCKFYGAAASIKQELLIDTGGNQCALIVEAHAPCRMEIAALDPELEACELNGSGRAIAFAKFRRVGCAVIQDVEP
jgi:hypothetical protein